MGRIAIFFFFWPYCAHNSAGKTFAHGFRSWARSFIHLSVYLVHIVTMLQEPSHVFPLKGGLLVTDKA